jgi:hypothetical protein
MGTASMWSPVLQDAHASKVYIEVTEGDQKHIQFSRTKVSISLSKSQGQPNLGSGRLHLLERRDSKLHSTGNVCKEA